GKRKAGRRSTDPSACAELFMPRSRTGSTRYGLGWLAGDSPSGEGTGSGRATRLPADWQAILCTRSCRGLTGRSWLPPKEGCFAGCASGSASRGRKSRDSIVFRCTVFSWLPAAIYGSVLKRVAPLALMREPAGYSGLVRSEVLRARQRTPCASIANKDSGPPQKRAYL